MSELRDNLRSEFYDREYRHIYADESLNTYIATQIKVIREQRGLTQKQLAEETGMAQPRIAVLEDVNYSSWSINTLRRLAQAFDVRLSVKFESFSSLIQELDGFSRASLERDSFEDDLWFQKKSVESGYLRISRTAVVPGTHGASSGLRAAQNMPPISPLFTQSERRSGGAAALVGGK